MSIVSNFVKIATTGIFVQFISFLFYPVIGRVYSPDEFGNFAFYSSLVVIFSVFVTGQFSTAVTNPKSDDEATQLLSISFWLVVVFSALMLLGSLIVNQIIPIDPNWFLFPVYLSAYSIFEGYRLISVRKKDYTLFNFSQITNRLGSNLLKIIKPLTNGSLWLLSSEIFCFIASNIYLKQKSKTKIIPLNKLDWSLVKKYKEFPLFHSTSLLTQFLISELPAIYFKSTHQTELLGYYSMGNRLFVQPCLLIGYSLNPVLIHKFNDKLTTKTLLKIFGILSCISLVALVTCKFVHLKIVSVLLGDKWLPGKEIYAIQTWLISTKFFMGTVLALVISQNKSKYLMSVRFLELTSLLLLVFIFKTDFLNTFIVCELTAEAFLLLVGLKISQLSEANQNEQKISISL